MYVDNLLLLILIDIFFILILAAFEFVTHSVCYLSDNKE